MVASELSERLRASCARAHRSEKPCGRNTCRDDERQVVEQLREDGMQSRRRSPLAASSADAAGPHREQEQRQNSDWEHSVPLQYDSSGGCAGRRRGGGRNSRRRRRRRRSPRRSVPCTSRSSSPLQGRTFDKQQGGGAKLKCFTKVRRRTDRRTSSAEERRQPRSARSCRRR